MPPKSKKQAGLMGAAAGGEAWALKRLGMTQAQAKEYLRGSKEKSLPKRTTKRKGK